jgi:hypothetical protein
MIESYILLRVCCLNIGTCAATNSIYLAYTYVVSVAYTFHIRTVVTQLYVCMFAYNATDWHHTEL